MWNNLTVGWTLLIVSIIFFAGVQLVSIWMISEYIIRIYDDTRNRPEYIISKKINYLLTFLTYKLPSSFRSFSTRYPFLQKHLLHIYLYICVLWLTSI